MNGTGGDYIVTRASPFPFDDRRARGSQLLAIFVPPLVQMSSVKVFLQGMMGGGNGRGNPLVAADAGRAARAMNKKLATPVGRIFQLIGNTHAKESRGRCS